MKYSILFFCFAFSLGLKGKSQDTIYHLKDVELNSPMFHFWDSIHAYAEQTLVLPLFEKHGIKLSCAECSRASITVMLAIDRNGKCNHMIITEYSLCDRPLFCDIEEVLGNYLMQVVFPSSFRNVHLVSRFGKILKC